jgi:hypothetical protein
MLQREGKSSQRLIVDVHSLAGATANADASCVLPSMKQGYSHTIGHCHVELQHGDGA